MKQMNKIKITFTITWCIGHLVEPLEPEGYDERYKRWSYEDLPIIPDVWRYRVRPETKKQYDIVAGLLNDRRFSEVLDGLAIRGNDAQNDQDSVRESVNAWISGLGYF